MWPISTSDQRDYIKRMEARIADLEKRIATLEHHEQARARLT